MFEIDQDRRPFIAGRSGKFPKRSFPYLLAGLLFMMPFPAFPARAELSGDQIIAKMEEATQINDGRYLIDLTAVRPGKEVRTSRMQVYVKDAAKVLARTLAPAQEKGQGYLKLGEDEWLYLPNANKSIRISGSQSVQGSDVQADDILKVKLGPDYAATLSGREVQDGQELYRLELKAKRSGVIYSKLIYWIRTMDLLPLKTEYYALSGKLLKTTIYSQIKNLGGRMRPTIWEVTSESRKGNKTVVTFWEAEYHVDYPDSMFTRMYLEKGK